MPKLFLDFELASELNLDEVGAHNYVNHTSTHIILASYAVDNEEVKVWEISKGGIEFPILFETACTSPDWKIVAWNGPGFERLVIKKHLNRDLPVEKFIDPMILARYLSMPGKMGRVCEILKLPPHLSKKDGKKLIELFCLPQRTPIKEGQDSLFDMSEPWFNNEDSHPTEWKEFVEYGKYDIISLRAILDILSHHPLPPSEIEAFVLDQKINDRGMPVDMQLVRNMDNIATKAKERAHKRIQEISGIENPNSNPQILEWVRKNGYPFGSLGKPFVASALAGIEISSECAEVLELRKESAKTSDSKLESLKLAISPDGFVRDQFSFMGAPRTGRWSGHGVQLHNLPRATKEVEKKIERAVQLLKAGDYEALKAEFSSVMDVIAGCIRPCFCAPEGYQLVVADLNAIEPRVLGYVAHCQKLLSMFIKGEEPYMRFAEALYGIPYLDMVYITPDGRHVCKPEYKDHRQGAKPGLLGCGYMLSAGEQIENPDGDIIWTGLMGYARTLQIDMPLDLAEKAVKVYRQEYSEVVKFWYDCENACEAAVTQKRKIKLGCLVFDMHGQTLRILLPSGRYLHYIRPQYMDTEFRGKMKKTLTFEGMNGKTKQWERQTSYGGRITENIVQAIARDVLMNGLKLANQKNLFLVGHVHDEIICLERLTRTAALAELIDAMKTSPIWALDLPLGAEGFVTKHYRKG